MSGTDTYKEAGVDIEAGDDFSKIAGSICAASNGNSPFIRVNDVAQGHFRGAKGFAP